MRHSTDPPLHWAGSAVSFSRAAREGAAHGTGGTTTMRSASQGPGRRQGRWRRRLAAGVIGVLAAVPLIPGAALANVAVGTALEFAGSSAHFGYADWTQANDYLRRIEVDPGGSFAS